MYRLSIEVLVPFFNKKYIKRVIPFLNKYFAIDWFNHHIDIINKKYPGDPRASIDKYTEIFDFTLNVIKKQLLNIPQKGPCIIIANHPTDLLDDVLVASTIAPIRRDYKYIANGAVHKFNLWNDVIFPFNLYGEKSEISQNSQAIRDTISWLNEGHVVITYPGARPSNFSKKIRSGWKIWSSLPMLLAKKTGAPIIPMKIILKEPIHHRLLKSLSRYLYSFLILRVLKYFSNKSAKVIVGTSYKVEQEKISKRDAGKTLFDLVNKL